MAESSKPLTMAVEDCWISLLSGATFNYNKPEESDVTIDDLASATSNICRYAGHLPRFYSVAQHLVNASRIVEGITGNRNDPAVFAALMHDTAEAFTNDLPTPLKWAFPVFKELEVSIETAMGKKFGFEYPYPDSVKFADTVMLIAEKIYIKEDTSVWPAYESWTAESVEPYLQYIDLDSWQPRRAKKEFLKRYWELKNASKRETTPREQAEEFFRKVAPRTPIRPAYSGRKAAA